MHFPNTNDKVRSDFRNTTKCKYCKKNKKKRLCKRKVVVIHFETSGNRVLHVNNFLFTMHLFALTTHKTQGLTLPHVTVSVRRRNDVCRETSKSTWQRVSEYLCGK